MDYKAADQISNAIHELRMSMSNTADVFLQEFNRLQLTISQFQALHATLERIAATLEGSQNDGK